MRKVLLASLGTLCLKAVELEGLINMVLYQSYAQELLSKIGRLNHLVKHAPSIGTFHENIVSNYLEGFLSRRFSIKTGFVFNSETNEVSPQLDILVIDEMSHQLISLRMETL
ncbi:hypothetical protein L1D55_01220 [Vibrio sp. Isolate22]|uniref:DUF6602 domain-containing protein n=1 Tax=Vibrio sp. Isolate22 TaxID=2908532 RepID=UPI001EFC5AD5|nr:DUF6602 domain-containing protein [Vibrio sp. Isolate22]MCG9690433.1 hypothetical protein [Vibrio sp. Isolate22]